MATEEVPRMQVEEQFANGEQQRQAVTFGMWIFLATEVLFFGGLLVIYSAYRICYPQDFAIASRHLDFLLGTINTAILLSSSFLMAGAINAARLRDRRSTVILLLLTACCGAAFLTIKGYEWSSAIKEGFGPGNLAATNQPPGVHLFYSLYFIMTGLHGLHLIIGITLITAVSFNLWRKVPFHPNQNRLTLLGLYWHFVDIVWIFLYPLLYFIGRSS